MTVEETATIERSGAPLLVAEVDCTSTRLALAYAAPTAGAGVTLCAQRAYATAAFGGLYAILQEYFRATPGPRPHVVVIAGAGAVLDGEMISDALPWRVHRAHLATALGGVRVELVNDFVAIGHALPVLRRAPGTRLCGAVGGDLVPAAVIGVGGGIGTSICTEVNSTPVVLASEMGQTGFAPGDSREAQVLTVLAKRYEYVSYENALSGSGLLALYEAVAELRGRRPAIATSARVLEAARLRQDGDAAEAVELFCVLLGAYAGDVAMAFMSAGGVYLTGPMLEPVSTAPGISQFMRGFLRKGRMTAFLQRVPVKIVTPGPYALIGAALWHYDSPNASVFAPESVGVR